MEAGALLGRRPGALDDMRRAARDLKALGPSAALVKGGHLRRRRGDAVRRRGTARLPPLPSTRATRTAPAAPTRPRSPRGSLLDGSLRDAVRGAKQS